MSVMCDATSGTSDRLVKVPVFQPGKLTVFQSKFKAVVSMKGFAEAVEPGFESRLPNKENDTLSDRGEDKEKVKNKIKNALAVHYMTVSFENNEEQLGYINDARTSDWPSAIACNVCSTLEAEFKPSNTLATSEILKRLMVFELRKKEAQRKNGRDPSRIQLQN